MISEIMVPSLVRMESLLLHRIRRELLLQKPKLFLWKEKWNLTQYDVKDSGGSEVIRWYRARKTWAGSKSQKGAYKILDNAKKC